MSDRRRPSAGSDRAHILEGGGDAQRHLPRPAQVSVDAVWLTDPSHPCRVRRRAAPERAIYRGDALPRASRPGHYHPPGTSEFGTGVGVAVVHAEVITSRDHDVILFDTSLVEALIRFQTLERTSRRAATHPRGCHAAPARACGSAGLPLQRAIQASTDVVGLAQGCAASARPRQRPRANAKPSPSGIWRLLTPANITRTISPRRSSTTP